MALAAGEKEDWHLLPFLGAESGTVPAAKGACPLFLRDAREIHELETAASALPLTCRPCPNWQSIARSLSRPTGPIG